MTTIDEATLAALRPDLQEALAEVGSRFGINLKAGVGIYHPSGGTGSMILEMSVSDIGDGKTGAQLEFERLAPRFGLSPEDYELEFSYQRNRYKLVGINPKRSVDCLRIVRLKDDREFVFSVDLFLFCRNTEIVCNKKMVAA